MESWEEFLPVEWEPSLAAYKWSHGLRCALRTLSEGAPVSGVRTGEALADFLSQVAQPDTHPDAVGGVEHYFDEVAELAHARSFFADTLPEMARLALRLPELLGEQRDTSEKMAHEVADSGDGGDRGLPLPVPLQILDAQQPGLVLVTQELCASLLACAFLCLFPAANRPRHRLPEINMDKLFAGIFGRSSQVHKLHCIVHYFRRVCGGARVCDGAVSFHRKVLPLGHRATSPTFWATSRTSLCRFEAHQQGAIEDAGWELAQVDFANKFLGGGALRRGCVQEEIRFMLSPELLVGMLFLPALAENETVEITGAERFSLYAGYGGKFRFAGDFVDGTPRDGWGRRRTRIVAMDAKARPGEAQFREPLLLREVCKAYCGFVATETAHIAESAGEARKYTGIATGNWGCGAFGGDLAMKSMLQWLAASEAGWPSIQYYTFQDPRAERLSEAVRSVSENNYDVGQLWSLVSRYGEQRQAQDVRSDFFTWLLKARRPVHVEGLQISQ